MIKGLEATVLPLPRRSAEWRIIPDIMKAAAPVGAVSNTITSSGSMLPESPFYTLDSHLPTFMRMLIQNNENLHPSNSHTLKWPKIHGVGRGTEYLP